MAGVRSISVAERRARLGQRHLLAASARTDDVVDVVRSVVVLHASDPATVVLSAVARMATPSPAAVLRALYEERSILRMLGMRRTLFAVPAELIPVVHASSSLAVAANERRRLLKLLEEAAHPPLAAPGVPLDEWLRDVEARTLAAIRRRGDALAGDLSVDVPELGIQMAVNQGKRYAGKIGVSSRVLLLLAADGLLARGHPRGGWTQGQHRWTPMEIWLGAPITVLDPGEARVELVRRWLERFGPGTVADLKWWTGWTLGQVRGALAALDTVAVDLDGAEGIVLSGDEGPVDAPEPWVALLPSLDPTAMGWQERSWYLGAHKAQVFDRNGNAGATVWVDGRIVGGWAQRADGEVVTRLLDDVGGDATTAVHRAAAQLQNLLGDVRVTPRFPAPLDRALRS